MRFTLSTLAQPYIFAAFVYTGILLGILYSVFTLIKKLFGSGKAVTVITDILFCLFSGALVIYVLYSAVNLRLRFYYVFGLAAGFILYIMAISPFVKKIHEKLTKKNVDKKRKNDSNDK